MNRTKTTNKKREELSDICRGFLEKKDLFRWFIVQFFGMQKFLDLWDMAEKDDEVRLRAELESIWFDLPDHTFNIQSNPPGWGAFLSLIEE